MTEAGARAAAELAARVSYGRLVALLAARTRDIAVAEDMLAHAFEMALARWPLVGVPDNPDAWLLTVARRDGGRAVRHRAVVATAEPHLRLMEEERMQDAGECDPRLALLFVCAHPAIDPLARTPLMLTTVLGLTAERVAGAYLVPPATMAQRLTRAKGRIKATGIAFSVPDGALLPERLEAVLEAVYAAHTLGAHGLEKDAAELVSEALWLAKLLAELLPGEPEAQGLLALLRFVAARRPASRAADGAFVPLPDQDPQLWDGALIARAEADLQCAATARRPGRFQLEAAIHSAHCWRRTGEPLPWDAILGLYDKLMQIAPTMGSAVARATVLGEVYGAGAALQALEELELPPDYLPGLASRAHWLKRAGQASEASAAYRRAALVAVDPAVRGWLLEQA